VAVVLDLEVGARRDRDPLAREVGMCGLGEVGEEPEIVVVQGVLVWF
jgi:hypothetical protein